MMNHSYKKIALVTTCALALITGGCLWYAHTTITTYSCSKGTFRPYEKKLHRNWIHKVMRGDWQILISSPDFDVDFMLEHDYPRPAEPELAGKMKIAVLHDHQNNPVGFTVYYMRSAYQGEFLFVAVDKEHRGNHYSKELVRYGLADMKAQGAKYAKLHTRETNTIAQKLYTGLGFVEFSRQHEFITYRKEL